jgi:hypothetical protein
MAHDVRMLNQLRWAKLRGSYVAIVVTLLISVVVSPGTAQAATIPFSFEVTADTSIFGVPSLATLNLPTTIIGSGAFGPLGSAIYSEAGTITFMMLPSGAFVPSSVMNNFTASFNGGANTFMGTNSVGFGAPNAMGLPTFSSTLTIQSGTGIFSGATGFATATGTGNPPSVTFSGNGQITASALNAVPEPGSIALVGTCMAGLAGIAVVRKRSRS